MPRVGPKRQRDVIRKLRDFGFEEVRRNRGQIAYIGSVKNEDGTLETRKVFVPDEREIDTDSLMMIIRRSGIPREEFE